jgi:hypothetical protein
MRASSQASSRTTRTAPDGLARLRAAPAEAEPCPEQEEHADHKHRRYQDQEGDGRQDEQERDDWQGACGCRLSGSER